MNVPGMNQTAVGNAGRIFSVRSAVFEVRVTVDIGGVQRTVRALVLRNNSPTDVRVMSFGWL